MPEAWRHPAELRWHAVANSLMALQNAAELLQRDRQGLSERQQRCAEIVATQARRLVELLGLLSPEEEV